MRRSILAASSISALILGVAATGLTLMPGLAPRPAQPDVDDVKGPLADHPAAKMIGVWRGTATTRGRDGKTTEAIGVERARWNLAGTAIIVEGLGYVEDPATGARTVGHDAFGLIEMDQKTGQARFFARRAGAAFEEHALEVIKETGQMRWTYKPGAPGVTLQFSVTLTDDLWHEVGEASVDDGKTWNKFMESKLNRVKE
jgi:hypothetical protein